MPSKLVKRNFIRGGIYHIANYGLEGRPIFRKKEDYDVFSSYVAIYIKPLEEVLQTDPTLPKRLQIKNVSGKLDLLAYCLLPNHFHFVVQQHTIDAVAQFMKQLTNAYTFYFNQKYHRSGSLMQGRYKAILLPDTAMLTSISRFIHLHPYISKLATYLNKYPYSSYMEYTTTSPVALCQTDTILSSFASKKACQKYTLDLEDYKKTFTSAFPFTLDKAT